LTGHTDPTLLPSNPPGAVLWRSTPQLYEVRCLETIQNELDGDRGENEAQHPAEDMDAAFA
jgi:hypothetical protein